jgi:adenylate cyclase
MKGLIVGVVVGGLGALFGVTNLGAEFEKHVGLTWMFKVRGPIEAPPNVAVIAINEHTAAKLDLPPLPRDWPRSTHGVLIRSLVARGASVIVLDLSFDRSKSPDEDGALAEAVAEAGRVILIERLDGRSVPITDSAGRNSGLMWVEKVVPPIPSLAKVAKGLGPFPLPKLQVAIFQFWAFKSSAGSAPTMPAVALQVHALRSYDLWREMLVRTGAPGADTLPVGADEIAGAEDVRKLMVDLRLSFMEDPELAARLAEADGQENGYVAEEGAQTLIRALTGLYSGSENRYLNFYGPPGSIATIPYHAVIIGDDPNVPPEALDFTNKIVFVGYSDLYNPGQPDRFYTVFTRRDGVDLSGVEIMATAFGNLLTDRSLWRSEWLVTVTILAAFGLLMGFVAYSLPALMAVPLTLVASVLYAYGVQYAFNTADAWLPLATPMLGQLPLALFIGLAGQYLIERRQKVQVSRAISYYLPENAVKDLTERGFDPSSLNKVVHGTCLATDMAGFTTISETMSPEDLAKFMNEYFDTLAEPLKRHGVDLTEFHADSIMCAWTATDPDTAVNHKAIEAALEVIEAIGKFNAEHEPLALHTRIGLETGQIYIGHTGGGGHFAYSILGDCANTASRMEGLNKHLGTYLLATQAVVEGVEGLLTRPLGDFQFVGKTDLSQVVHILGRKSGAEAAQISLCERFAEAIKTFRAEQWAKAGELFAAIRRDYPDDGPTRFYLERCQGYLADRPATDEPWVIRMDRK